MQRLLPHAIRTSWASNSLCQNCRLTTCTVSSLHKYAYDVENRRVQLFIKNTTRVPTACPQNNACTARPASQLAAAAVEVIKMSQHQKRAALHRFCATFVTIVRAKNSTCMIKRRQAVLEFYLI